MIDSRRLFEILVVVVGIALFAGALLWINWTIAGFGGSRRLREDWRRTSVVARAVLAIVGGLLLVWLPFALWFYLFYRY